MYADTSLISKFIIEVSLSADTSLTCILLKDPVSKCILVKTKGVRAPAYVIKVPNNYERQ